MDNFRKNKHQPQNRRASNIDGFVGSAGKPVQKKPIQPVQYKSARVADFTQKDGFHPSQQSKITAANPAARRPQRTAHGAIALNMPQANERPKKKRSKKRVVLKSFAALFICLALVGGFLFAKGYINLHKVLKGGATGAAALQKNVDPDKLKGEGDGRINILLLGKGGDGHEAPDLTDTILVASIDPVQNEAAILSVPRDLYVPTTSNKKINAVYAEAKRRVLNGKKIPDQAKAAEEAGLKAIDDKVSTTMGIPIHYHVIVDFKAFQDAINTVGGIDIDVKNPLVDTLWLEDTGKNYTINVKPGVQHFDGRKALVYSRSRYTSARGDFDRTERQRAVMVALKEKVFTLGTFSNPVKISQLIGNFGSHVNSNLSVNEILRLYDITKSIDSSKVSSVGLADPPNNYVRTGNIDGSSVVIPTAGLTNYTEIQNYVRNVLKDGYIKNENASIMVLNGTNVAGLATVKAKDLKSYGYTVTQTADAPTKDYQKTVLVDLRGGSKKYTKHYLEQRLGVTAVTSLPDSSIIPGNADFVIILGQNESTSN